MQRNCIMPAVVFWTVRKERFELYSSLLAQGKFKVENRPDDYVNISAIDDGFGYFDQLTEDIMREFHYLVRLCRADAKELSLVQLHLSNPVKAYLGLQAFEKQQRRERTEAINWLEDEE